MRVLLRILFFILIMPAFQFLQAQTLDIRIENIQHKQGSLRFAFFADEAGFYHEKPVIETMYKKCLVENGILHVKIDVPSGIYGLSVLDDENDNGKMEYNFFGIPREGFGFSGYMQKGIKRPRFNDFCFTINKEESLLLVVRMKYY